MLPNGLLWLSLTTGMYGFNLSRLALMWFVSLLAWCIITFGLALQMAHSNAMPWNLALIQTGGFWISWALVAPLFFLATRSFPITREKGWRSIGAHLALSILAVTFSYSVHSATRQEHVPRFERSAEDKHMQEQRRQFFFLLHNVIVLVALISCTHAAHFYKIAQNEKSRSLELNAQLTESRLQALSMQLQPHFIFNALNSIAELIHEDVEKADSMIVTLSDFLRMTINLPHIQELPMQEELQFARLYLALEKIRFEERIMVDIEIDDDVQRAAIPTLLLQPLLENAFQHGFSNLSGPCALRIQGKQAGDFLLIRVQNDAPTTASTPVEGTGLRNSRARLNSLYAQRAQLNVKAGAFYTVELKIPLRLI